MLSLRKLSPIRVIIGNEDITRYIDDGLTFSNVDPGGYEAAQLSLPKDMPNTLRGMSLRIDTGLEVAWEGRIGQIQRSLGNRTQINGEGYGALFKDTVNSMVFVDRDLTRWQAPSYTFLSTIAYPGNRIIDTTTIAADSTNQNPVLLQQITDSWSSPATPWCDAWYDAGPSNLVGQIYYNLTTQEAAVGAWTERVDVSPDDTAATILSTANLHPSGSGYWTPASQWRWGRVVHFNTATNAGAQGATYNVYWNLAVYGNHGLAGRGSDPVGFYPSDIFRWVVSQVPGVQAGTIQATDSTGYIVPHAAYYTPVTLDTMAHDVAVAQGWHWGVWESSSPLTGNPLPRADFRPRPAAGDATAFCRRQDCETLDIREDLTDQFNACNITYTLVDGTQGTTLVTQDNPILDNGGVATKTLVLTAGTMTPSDAALYAVQALEITNQQARVAGSLTIINPISQGGGLGPAWLLKAGIDRLRIADLPSTDAWGIENDVPISRVEATMSTSGWTTSVEIGTGANLVETIQARLAAATALAAQGGV